MKRISLILLSLALLAACVPTPETEFVVNKGDHTAEQKINATPKPQEGGRAVSGLPAQGCAAR